MWGQFVEKKAEWIGGELHEIDVHAGEGKTKIIDIRLEPNGDDSAMFVIAGEDFTCCADVKCLGIGGDQQGDGLNLSTPFGCTFRITKP
jgi:hypothetical protein